MITGGMIMSKAVSKCGVSRRLAHDHFGLVAG
jgi:hypothetical protein